MSAAISYGLFSNCPKCVSSARLKSSPVAVSGKVASVLFNKLIVSSFKRLTTAQARLLT